MSRRGFPAIIRWLKPVGVCVAIAVVLAHVLLPFALQGKFVRDHAVAIGDLAHDVWLAGEIYMMDHDGQYPSNTSELQSNWVYQKSKLPDHFIVTADSKRVDGGYSYFVVEGAKGSNQIAVGYVPSPTWQEVLWTKLAARFDHSNRETKACNPDWASSTEPVLDSIGGTCGNVDVRLARGLNYGQVVEQLSRDYHISERGGTLMGIK